MGGIKWRIARGEKMSDELESFLMLNDSFAWYLNWWLDGGRAIHVFLHPTPMPKRLYASCGQYILSDPGVTLNGFQCICSPESSFTLPEHTPQCYILAYIKCPSLVLFYYLGILLTRISLGTLASSHRTKTCNRGVRWIGYSEFPIVWFGVCLYMSALLWTGNLSRMNPAVTRWCWDRLQSRTNVVPW